MLNDGDIVMLKSGGPPMTVTNARASNFPNHCYCKWFDSKDDLRGDRFNIATLKIVESGESE